LGLIENFIHKKSRGNIPIIIHVNGTRGKSTTTRMITYGLQNCGINAWGKTTGSEPRLIINNGKEINIKRRGLPKIKEQLSIIRRASKANVDILVLECMALSPEIQYLSGNRIVKPDYSIITNIYLDHEEIMGNNLKKVKEAIFLSVPNSVNLLIMRETFKELFDSLEIPNKMNVFKGEMSNEALELVNKFQYPNFPDNIILSLNMAKIMDVNINDFKKGMLNAPSDPGISSLLALEFNDKEIIFGNAFAANDEKSTLKLWQKFFTKAKHSSAVAVLNLREDRQIRSKKMIQLYKNKLSESICRLYIIGSKDKNVISIIKDKKIATSFLGNLNSAEDILLKITNQEKEKEIFIFGYGNYKGAGEVLIKFMGLKGEKIDV